MILNRDIECVVLIIKESWRMRITSSVPGGSIPHIVPAFLILDKGSKQSVEDSL